MNKTKFDIKAFQLDLGCAASNLRLVFYELAEEITKDKTGDALYAAIVLVDMLAEKLDKALEAGEV